METIDPDTTMLEGNKSSTSLTQSKEIMHETDTIIAVTQNKPTDIDTNAMLMEEVENSSSFIRSKEIMDMTETYIDIIDTLKELTDIGDDPMFVEMTEQSKEVVNVPKETTALIPEVDIINRREQTQRLSLETMSVPLKILLLSDQSCPHLEKLSSWTSVTRNCLMTTWHILHVMMHSCLMAC